MKEAPAVAAALGKLNGAEKNDAIKLLVHLGLFFYFKESHSTSINVNVLCDLCEKYIPIIPKVTVPKRQARKDDSAEGHGRLNAMFSYPFQDEFGTVNAAIHPNDDTRVTPILRMTSPARRRLAQHVFDEMCLGSSKMKLVDVPEALKACQLQISPELSKALKHYGSKQQGANVSGDVTIDSQQWYAIVKRCVRREKILAVTGSTMDNNGDVYEEGDNISSGSTVTQDSVPSLLQGIVEEVDFEQQALEEERLRRQHQHRQELRSQHADQIRQDRQAFHKNKAMREEAALATVGSRRIRHLQESSTLGGGSSGTKKSAAWRDPFIAARASSNGRGGPRLSAETVKARALAARHDAGRRHQQSKVTKAAMGRYADLESGTATLDIADAFLESPVGRELLDPSSFMTNKTRAGGAPHASNNFEDDDDIISIVDKIEDKSRRGRAALAQSQANYILHGSRAFANGGGSSSATTRPQQQPSVAGGLGSGHKTVRERENEQSLLRESRSLYAQGWRSSRGGWVADFGPPHTHALNRDEDFEYGHSLSQMRENFYRSRNEAKRRESLDGPLVDGVDDQLMSTANAVLGRPTTAPAAVSDDVGLHSYSSLRSPSQRVASLREEYGLHHDQEQQGPRGRSSQQRTSSNAGAAAGAAGVRCHPLHSDDDDGNDDAHNSSDSTPINLHRPSHHEAGSDDNISPRGHSDAEYSSASAGASDALLGRLQSSLSLRAAAPDDN